MNDIVNETGQFLTSFALVALVAIPLAVVLARLARPLHRSTASDPVYLEGFELLLLAIGVMAVPAVITVVVNSLHKSLLWVNIIVAPILLVLSVFRGAMQNPTRRWLPDDLVRGIWTWFWLTPATNAVHLLVTWSYQASGLPLEQHPLSQQTALDDGFGGLIFVLSVCVAGPMFEEIVFRGMLIAWASAKRYRAWIIMAVALLVTLQAPIAALPNAPRSWEGVMFVLIHGFILSLQSFLSGKREHTAEPEQKKDAISAIYATSVLFAAAHSAVWPTPIPLFFLGLGLGWLTSRTGSITAATVVHGLFNAVSTVMVFRQPGA